MQGLKVPVAAKVRLDKVGHGLAEANLNGVIGAWSSLRSALEGAKVTASSLTAIDMKLADLQRDRVDAIHLLAGDGQVTPKDALVRTVAADQFVAGWTTAKEQIDQAFQAASNSANDTLKGQIEQFKGAFTAASSPLGTTIGETARAIDEPVTDLELKAVNEDLDGWGMAKVELQVWLKTLLPGHAGGPPRESVAAATTLLSIGFLRQDCVTEPTDIEIKIGATDANTYAVADGTAGKASVKAQCVGLATTDPVLISLRAPWRSILAGLIGLLIGALLRPHLSTFRIPTDPNRDHRLSSGAVDVGAGLVLLVAWFAGYVSWFSADLPSIDPRSGVLAKVLTGMLCGLVGVPILTAKLKAVIRGTNTEAAPEAGKP